MLVLVAVPLTPDAVYNDAMQSILGYSPQCAAVRRTRARAGVRLPCRVLCLYCCLSPAVRAP